MATRTITIDPVTRIEGHAKITVHLDEDGRVGDARFHVTEFRGFERFCVGREFSEMPGITSRVCGICPVSHLIASAKAGDAIMRVRVSPTAEKLRRVMHWAQILQSHALSLFHLSGPDLLLGLDADPARRHVFGLVDSHPELALRGIRLRKYGQQIIKTLGGKSIHPAWAVPGGVREPLAEADRATLAAGLPEAYATVEAALDLVKDLTDTWADDIGRFGDFPSLFLALVTPDGALAHYDGVLRVVDAQGRVLEDGVPAYRYRDIIGEAVEPWTYLKFPYYKPYGYPAGMYRVGPLARLNVCDVAGTPRADRELRQFRHLAAAPGMPVTASFHYHYARAIEMLYCLERLEETLADPDLTRGDVRSHADVNRTVGIGVAEAPRGTLFHEYHVDGDGVLTDVNLLIATGQNNLAMNETVRQIARAYVDGDRLTEGMLNRVEHGIRLFDPCLSCSTHALGTMPMRIELYGPDGRLLDTQSR